MQFKIEAAKGLFFDSDAVIKATTKAERKNLSRGGFLVRRKARDLIKKGKKKAKPGRPPKSHTGLLKKFIFFAFDLSTKTVVVGPAKLSGTSSDNATEVLENGGTAYVKEKGKAKLRHYAGNPFMGPALDIVRPELPPLWADTVKR